MTDQCHCFEPGRLLRWLGAAVLVLPVALAACANSNAPHGRASSDIRGNDHRDAQTDNIYILGRTYRF